MFVGLNADDYAALVKYLERGGVVFLMIENHFGGMAQNNFFRKIFNSNTVITAEHDSGGAIYKLTDEDADVLSWPFDDVRGKYWGQDLSQTLYVDNIPASELDKIEIYSQSSVNFKAQYPTAVSMFRHKTLNLFYAGDTGILSNEKQNGVYNATLLEPFATDGNNFPIPDPRYGAVAQTGSPESGKPAGGWQVHNSALFGNVFAYLVAQSHYMRLDKTP